MKKNLISSIIILSLLFSANVFSQTATLKRTLEIKNIDGISIPYQNGIPLSTFEKQNRKMLDLSGTWKKERTAANDNITLADRDSAGYANLITEANGRNNSVYDDSAWEEKQIPSVENKMNEYPNVPESFKDGVGTEEIFLLMKKTPQNSQN